MRKLAFITAAIGLYLSVLTCCCFSSERLKRADSFFGIHLDFHCSLNEQNVGANTTDQMVNDLIDLIHPDFIQIDCKGHPGISSYPTKIGNPCSNIIGDPLRVWRRVTEERGIALYMHYSGVWDDRAVKLHPEWAIVMPDGNRSNNATSSFGPYINDLLIPQLKELALDYGVDGVWVDGDCWAILPDYCDAAKKEFQTKTGIETIPQSKEDPHWYTWLEFHRETFRNRLRHWVDALHQAAPEFQIASNWAFTDHMPEPVSADVDFLSGDYTPHNSIVAARCSARFIASQQKPWDLMAWSFAKDENDFWKQKGAEQIKREAACVLSQGGGFQAYYQQNRDGSVNLETVIPMKEVGEFCRARQPFCFRTTTVPQAALVIPTQSHYERISEENGGLFPNTISSWQRGFVSAVIDNQYSLDVMTDTCWREHAAEYPVTILCETQKISGSLTAEMAEYVNNGGALFISGKDCFSPFAESFKDAEWKTDSNYSTLTIASYGKGRIAVLNENTAYQYSESLDPRIRDMVGSAISYIFPNPMLKLEGSHNVDISIRRLTDGRLSIHLVNTSGPHNTAHFVDSVDPIGPLSISLKLENQPQKIVLQPEGRELPFEWKDGKAEIQVEKIGIYDIIVID